MLPHILKRIGAIMALPRKYYNAYSDLNGETVNKYAVTFTLIGLYFRSCSSFV